ncbi:MAG: tetratricopeptide repeat protein [Smithella sp.]|jgi:tetratricopeptide (TPR) repeat protein
MLREKIAALLVFSAFLSTVLYALPLRASVEVFEREYTYQATKIDTRESSRAIALEQAKKLLLDELGIYVEATSIVEDDKIKANEIKVLTAGVVKTEILDEKWDGSKYWMKVKLEADPNDVAKSIAELRKNQEMVEELKQTKKDKENALQEIDNLKTRLAAEQEDITEQKQKYDAAINDLAAANLTGNGDTAMIYGDYDNAAASYKQVVEMEPDNANAIYNLGVVYVYLGNYTLAVEDFNRAIVLNPQLKRAHNQIKIVGQIMRNPGQRQKLLHSPLKRQAYVEKNKPAFIVGEGKNIYIGNSLDEIHAQMQEKNESSRETPDEKLSDNNQSGRDDVQHQKFTQPHEVSDLRNANGRSSGQHRSIEQQKKIAEMKIRNLKRMAEQKESYVKGNARGREKLKTTSMARPKARAGAGRPIPNK